MNIAGSGRGYKNELLNTGSFYSHEVNLRLTWKSHFRNSSSLL